MLPRICIVSIVVVLLLLSSVSIASVPDWMTRQGTIGNALQQPDGTHVYLDAVQVEKNKPNDNPAYFVIGECFDREARIIVTSPLPNGFRLNQTIDIEGTLTTLDNGYKAIADATVYAYLDKEGNMLYHGPLIKGLLKPIPWQWKQTFAPTLASNDMAMSTMAMESASEGGDPDPSPLDGATYYNTIAEAKSQPDGTFVELQCKPVQSVSTGYFIMAEDGTADTLKVYYTNAVSATDRVNRAAGTMKTDAGQRIMCINSGPGFNPAIDQTGSVLAAASGTIAWAKTFSPDTVLPLDGRSSALEGKTVTFVDSVMGYLYIQEPDGSSAIRVWSTGFVPGDTVNVSGTITDVITFPTFLESGERAIDTTAITLVSSGDPVSPRGITNRIAWCDSFNEYTPGVTDGSGLNVIGMYVKTCGKVTTTFMDYNTFMPCVYLDDGSGLADGTINPDTYEPNIGLRVVYSGYNLNVDDFCVVEGALSASTDDGNVTYPVLLTEGTLSLTPPVPPAPAGLTAMPGNQKVYLNWNSCTNMGFNVYRKPSGGSYSKIGSATSNEYADSSLTNGTTYYYYVTAKGTTGESVPSDEVSATPSTDAPTISVVQVTQDANGLLTVQYNPQAGTGTAPDGVLICIDGNSIWEKPISEGTTFKYDTTQLMNGVHKLEVKTFATSTDESKTYAAVDSRTFTVDNFVYDFQIPEICTGHEAVTAKFKGNCSWTLSYEEYGSPIHTTSGSGTSLNYTWNGVGGYGATVVRLTAAPSGGGNYVFGGHTYTWYLGSVGSSTWCVHWARDQKAEGSLEDWFQARAQYVIQKLSSNSAYGVMPNPDFRRRWNDEADVVYLRDNAIGDCPSYDPPCIYSFHGHGGSGVGYGGDEQDGIITGTVLANNKETLFGLSAFHDSLLVRRRLHNLGPAVGNSIEYTMNDPFPGRLTYASLERRFKFVEINSCMGAGAFLHLAFGMPNRRFAGHGSAYIGLYDITYTDSAGEFSKRFWDYMSQKLCVSAAAYYAKQDCIKLHPGDTTWVVNYEIYGDPTLKLWR